MIQYRGKSRLDMAVGNDERFDINFLKWVWDYPKTKKPVMLKKFDQLSKDKQVIILKSPREVQRFIEGIF